ncbi:MAG TPA: lantibiotic dehydratase [Holophagaceae bacterium]|nr:lantibiotic dehydratase [Holophagaceae bacterium]
MPQPAVRPASCFAFRTPLLPFATYLDWSEGLASPGAWQDPEALEAALAADKARLRERLRALAARPEIREAIYLASPDLEESLERWFAEPESEKGQRTELALVRYFQRMAHRCTPFGLYAGHSLGRIGEATRLVLEGREAYQRHSRLDMDYLCGLVRALEADPAVRETLTYRPNTSLYRAGGRLRYAEAQDGEKGRTYKLVAVGDSPYLAATLARAEAGARLADLAAALVDDEISLEEAKGFIHELIDNQLLVSDLEPEVTGSEPTPRLASLLASGPAAEAGRHLQATLAELEGLDARGLGHAPEHYRGLARELEALPGKVDLSKLLQVDLHKPAPGAVLGSAVVEAMQEAVELLHRMAPGGGDAFTTFKEAFAKRYEDRWVSLVEVLDPESGIGFTTQGGRMAEGAPLLEGLAFPGGPAQGHGHGGAGGPGWSARDLHLFKRLQALDLSDPGAELVLEEADLKALANPAPAPLPDSLSAMGILAADSQEALDQGEFRLCVSGASGPSAARMLGRFCHGDAELEAEVRDLLQAEAAYAPDRVYAEIAHLSQGRMGNVLARPVLRDWEIVFLGRSGAPLDRQIPVSDLLVSVVEGRVVLRSRRLGKEVVPRLSSAANFVHRALDLYKFLGSLQGQGVEQGLGWSWGALQSEPRLPRVVRGKLVLARARWNVKAEEVKPFLEAKGAERYRAAQAWRESRQLPRFTLLADGDNELPVDLDNPLSLEAFCSLLKGRGAFSLLEDFPGPGGLVAQGPEGTYHQELVVPLFRTRAAEEAGPRLSPAPRPETGAARRFPPGSEWLYLKLYGGQSSGDRLLQEAVAPLVRELLASGAADGWFFIRYGDPDPHLRLRFHGDPARLHGAALPAANRRLAPFLEDGTLWRMELGTYDREVERYGGAEAIATAESWFQADSEAVMALVAAYPGDDGAEARWRLALAGMDRILALFTPELEARLELVRRAREDFGREFRAKQGPLEKQLGDRFRAERKGLEALLAGAPDEALAPGLAILDRRDAALAPLAADFARRAADPDFTTPLEELQRSLVHMFVNRAQRSAQRMQEFVLYDFLERLLDSRVARLRKGSKAAKAAPAPETDPVA